MADQRPRHPDPGIRLILGELRDLRIEMRADRRRADAERREDRQRAEADRQRAEEDRQRAEEHRQRADAERRRADERFERMMREFEQRSARRDSATQRAFRDIRTVGLSIVKTLNHHTRILERIDRKLGGPGNGRRWHEDGGGTHPRR